MEDSWAPNFIYYVLYIMKTIYLVRHAKSDRNDYDGNDKERGLSSEWKHDAKTMSTFMRDNNISLDRILTSPAKRARKTAKKFAKKLAVEKSHQLRYDDLYMAPAKILRKHIKSLDPSWSNVMIVAHNPGLEELVQSFDDAFGHYPTCGVVVLQLNNKERSKSEPSAWKIKDIRLPKKNHVEEAKE